MREENYTRVAGLYPRSRTGAKRLSVLELSPDNTEEKEEISS